MTREIWLFALLVFLGAAVIILTVALTDRWLTRADNPRLRRAVKVRRIPPTVETTARKKTVVYGDREVKAR